ncbi:MAG TPA: nucleotidyltransferase domain-containing protein [Gaiellaceae bacterium]|nr:nucleotidyltransferase domain-containing protein [Gaiellaceae bacterium]
MLDELLAQARADENVVGLVLFGSRARGAYVDEHSDWDVYVVVREARGDRPFRRGGQVETIELTLEELASPEDGNRYHLAWLEPQLDKTGEVAEALRAAVAVDPATADQPLDAYVNSYYRSLKNARVGLGLAALLDAQASIPWYLGFVFAVHGRLRPYNKWLEWELREHPLPVEIDLDRLERIARTGGLEDQQALFRETEALARAHGHGATIDGWEPDVAWLRG